MAALTKLKFLELRSSRVSDLRPLANLDRIKVLDLRGTQVKDLTSLASLSQLRRLKVDESISEDELAKLKKALPRLKISRDVRYLTNPANRAP